MNSDVYCDAKYHDGVAAIAVVCAGHTHTNIIETPTNNDAELAAVNYARELYPTQRIFNDNQTACREGVAIWIPREQNRQAHNAAALAWRQMPRRIGDEAEKPMSAKKTHKRRQRGASGRGVLAVCETNRLVWN